ncbi:sugar ABC transporter permease [Candidatus Pacearchaeota archaeon]|nr:sugar ABC transporter permease [Candidatus Pacearchaeota archaeon]
MFQFKYNLVYPVVIVLLLVIVAPLLYSFFVSLHRYIFQFGLGEWTYAKNYIKAFQEKDFLISMKNTFVLTFSVVSLEFLIALFLALLLNREDVRLKKFYTVILMIPIMMPPIVVGLIWKMLLHPELGIINYFIGLIGIKPLGWYGDPKLAMLTVIGVDIWHETSLILIILLAGLTSLDKTPYEAAIVDGASPLQIFRYITLPMLSPVITIAIVVRMIAAIKTYDLIYILTRGGPGHKTDTMSYYVFKMAFRKLSVGDAAAQSFILLIIILAFSLILIKTTELRKK